MDYEYEEYQQYLSVSKIEEHNQEIFEKLSKKKSLSPVFVSSTNAKTFWGKEWCKHVKLYQDYEHRLERGRTYLKHKAVIDLQITQGHIQALVCGQLKRPYKIEIDIDPMNPEKWLQLQNQCLGKIDSLVALTQGKLSKEILQIFCKPETGLFPEQKEIHMNCNCLDWAKTCKHLFAVLFATGMRLDSNPELFFVLRSIHPENLLQNVSISNNNRSISKDNISDIFKISLDTSDVTITDIKPSKVIILPRSSK